MSLIVQSDLQGLLDQALKEQGRLRTGNNYQYHCPFCHHRKRKMEVCLDDQTWHCWVCDAKGRGIYGLFKKMRVSEPMMVRLRKIIPFDKSPKSKEKSTFSPFEKEVPLVEKTDLHLPAEFKSLLDVSTSRSYRMAVQYSQKRGFTKWDIVKHNIGYCDSGEYRDRIIFPSYDEHNRLNFFTGRSWHDNSDLKYKNPEADRNIIGFENLIDWDSPVALCEGAPDAISIKRNAIPLFGKTMSRKLTQSLLTNRVKEVLIVLDDDALVMAMRHAELLMSNGKIVRLVNLRGKDPNVLGFAETTKQLRETPVLKFSDLMRMKLKLT